MKILHTADLHLGKTLNGYSLINDQEYIIEKIEEIIKDEKIDVVVIAGDIFDRAITSTEALDLFSNFVGFINKKKDEKGNDLDRKLIAILGNHDGDRIAFLNHVLKQSGINIVSDIERITIGDTIFSLIPYKNIHQFNAYYNETFNTLEEAYLYALDDLRIDKSKFNMLVCHDYFKNKGEDLEESDSEIKMNIGGLEALDVNMFKDFDYVALGHMHNSQKVGYEKIRYSGSILKYSFSEVNHNKSVVVIDTIEKTFNLIPLVPKRDLVDIKGTVDELTNPVFYRNYKYEVDYFRAILPRNEVDAYSRLKQIYPNLMEIKVDEVLEVRTIEKQIVKEKDYLELFNIFYREIDNKDLDKEEKEIVRKFLGGAR